MSLHPSLGIATAFAEERLRAAERRHRRRPPRAVTPWRRRAAGLALALVRRLDPSIVPLGSAPRTATQGR